MAAGLAECDVLIVGGSLVGSSAAALLGWHGIEAWSSKRTPDASSPFSFGYQRRARAPTARAMLTDEDALRKLGTGPTGLVLAHPDGFVAWRAKDDRDASTDGLCAVLAALQYRAR